MTDITLHDVEGNAILVTVEHIEMRRKANAKMGDPAGAASVIYLASGNHLFAKELLGEIDEMINRLGSWHTRGEP